MNNFFHNHSLSSLLTITNILLPYRVLWPSRNIFLPILFGIWRDNLLNCRRIARVLPLGLNVIWILSRIILLYSSFFKCLRLDWRLVLLSLWRKHHPRINIFPLLLLRWLYVCILAWIGRLQWIVTPWLLKWWFITVMIGAHFLNILHSSLMLDLLHSVTGIRS